MTTMTSTPAPLAAYLRRATLGLPPQRREEVWNELEEHVLCRAEQLEFQGHPPEQALQQALRELGPPLRVSAAMNGVHNMPRLIAFATVATLGVSAGLYALAQQPAPTMQVPVQTQAPQTKCVEAHEKQPELTFVSKFGTYNCYQDETQTFEGLFVSFQTLQKAFGSMGFKVDIQDSGNQLFLQPPIGRKIGPWHVQFKRSGESYVDLKMFLSLATSPNPFPAYFRNFDQPTVTFGTQTIQVDSQGAELSHRIYTELTEAALESIFLAHRSNALESSKPDASVPLRPVSTGMPEGEVIAAIQRRPSTSWEGNGMKVEIHQFTISLGVVDAQGNVNLQIPANARFTTTPQSQPGNDIMLLKLTNTRLGNMKSGIFFPK